MGRVRLSATIPQSLMDQIEKEMNRMGIDNRSSVVENIIDYYFENYQSEDERLDQIESEIEQIKSKVSYLEQSINLPQDEITELNQLAQKFDRLSQSNEKLENEVKKLADSLTRLVQKVSSSDHGLQQLKE